MSKKLSQAQVKRLETKQASLQKQFDELYAKENASEVLASSTLGKI